MYDSIAELSKLPYLKLRGTESGGRLYQFDEYAASDGTHRFRVVFDYIGGDVLRAEHIHEMSNIIRRAPHIPIHVYGKDDPLAYG